MPSRPRLSSDPDIHAGAAIYSPALLHVYDLLVHGLSNTLLWRCPFAQLAAWYSAHLSSPHLEIGVGTGYLLDRAPFPVARPSLTLLDLNPHSASLARRRLQRYHPLTVRANALEPLPFAPESFASIGLNYVLHCLPGTLPTKGRLLHECNRLLRPGGHLFGSTILADRIADQPISQIVMRLYNRRGIFHNAADHLCDLEAVVQDAFPRHHIHMRGHVALFAGTKET